MTEREIRFVEEMDGPVPESSMFNAQHLHALFDAAEEIDPTSVDREAMRKSWFSGRPAAERRAEAVVFVEKAAEVLRSKLEKDLGTPVTRAELFDVIKELVQERSG